MLFGPHHSLEYVFVFHRKGLEQNEGEQMGTEFSFFFVIYFSDTQDLILHSKMCDKEYYS